MRLSCFQACQVEPQLLLDLTKIYNMSLAQAQALVEDKSVPLYVAMFNERHLAACKIKQQEKTATLYDFTVREITRRRGVGKFLLSQVEKVLAEQGYTEVKLSVPSSAEFDAFATFMGYTFDQQQWSKAL